MKTFIIFLDTWVYDKRPGHNLRRTKRVKIEAADLASARDNAIAKHGGEMSMGWPVWP